MTDPKQSEALSLEQCQVIADQLGLRSDPFSQEVSGAMDFLIKRVREAEHCLRIQGDVSKRYADLWEAAKAENAELREQLEQRNQQAAEVAMKLVAEEDENAKLRARVSALLAELHEVRVFICQEIDRRGPADIAQHEMNVIVARLDRALTSEADSEKEASGD